MKQLFARLQVSPGFLGLVFLFAYLDSIRHRVAPGQLIDWYVLTPESALVTIPQVLLIILFLRLTFQKFHPPSWIPLDWGKVVLSFLVGLMAYLIIITIISMLIALVFDTWERNFTSEIILSSMVSRILDFVIYGGFYVAFLLLQKSKAHQEAISSYDLALAESKIQSLKQQLNPHFLFNNLNVLDQLIEENQKSAATFLQNFAELYRYALAKSEMKLVSWEDELSFAKNYFKLMEEKFGDAYRLEIILESPTGKLPPLTLQLLIENAVFHNFGTIKNPVTIQVRLSDNLIVSNNRIPFQKPRHTGGRGLSNLKKQVELINGHSLKIKESENQFTVTLPLTP
ncbi:histidine kinase [Algoriphagus sp.]|uniref:sensor histidine kinase n=1 Tax=Algoriphagus sp. TaxID=1872435 RepID=UPI0026385D2A|nr:histidine kinase [Algoriphagus sp.]